MANHKKKPGYHGCKLCKPHKSMGNSKHAQKSKYLAFIATKKTKKDTFDSIQYLACLLYRKDAVDTVQ